MRFIHDRHFSRLADFYHEHSYDESIFIMTKFPDGDKVEKDRQLEKVIELIEECVAECGYTARIARAISRYHDALWDNVELHLVGCSRRIAVVEDKFRGEFNPNVVMEWGFMRAMGQIGIVSGRKGL